MCEMNTYQRKFSCALLSLFISVASAHAGELYGPYKADMIRVIDGDTVKLGIHIWPGLVQQVNLRLVGVNSPESRGVPDCEKEAAKKASEFTRGFIGNSQMVTVSNVELGKYAGRALGRIEVEGKGDLGEALIAVGHAHEYHGGHREAWCQD